MVMLNNQRVNWINGGLMWFSGILFMGTNHMGFSSGKKLPIHSLCLTNPGFFHGASDVYVTTSPVLGFLDVQGDEHPYPLVISKTLRTGKWHKNSSLRIAFSKWWWFSSSQTGNVCQRLDPNPSTILLLNMGCQSLWPTATARNAAPQLLAWHA